MNRGSIRDATRKLLADANVTANALAAGGLDGDTWDDTEYNEAIEFAIGQYGIITGAFRTIVDLGAPSGTATNNNIFSSPDDLLRCNRVLFGASDDTEFEMRTLDETTLGFENSRRVTPRVKGIGANDLVPKRWCWYAGTTLMVFPDIATYSAATHVYMDYTQKPVDLVADNTALDDRILPEHHKYLKFGAASWLLMIDPDEQDVPKAKMFKELFDSHVKER